MKVRKRKSFLGDWTVVSAEDWSPLVVDDDGQPVCFATPEQAVAAGNEQVTDGTPWVVRWEQ